MNEATWTVGRLAEAASEVFAKRGLESARLDADLLLAEVLGLKRIELYTRFDMPVSLEQRSRYREFVKRRAASEPVAYILGHRDFYEHQFKVSPAVLIPRPESELIIDLGRAQLEARELEAPRILDLGVGSGCLVLSLLALFPDATAVGVDISSEALAVAAANADDLELRERVTWREGDYVDALTTEDRASPFDLVISNPPYIGDDEAKTLPPDVRDFEPGLALFTGDDPLIFHRRLLAAADSLLAPEGLGLAEMGAGQGDELLALAATTQGLASRGLARDLAGHDRVIAFALQAFPDPVAERLEIP